MGAGTGERPQTFVHGKQVPYRLQIGTYFNFLINQVNQPECVIYTNLQGTEAVLLKLETY